MAWVPVQGFAVGSTSSGTFISTSASASANTIGDQIIVGCWGTGTGTVAGNVTCSDNASTPNTYTQVMFEPSNGTGGWSAAFICNITSLPGSGNLAPKVTVTTTQAIAACAEEFSGGALILDGSAVGATGTNSTIQPGAMSTAVAADLLIAVAQNIGVTANTPSTPTGYTSVGTTSAASGANGGRFAYQILSGTVSNNNPSFGASGLTSNWACIQVALQVGASINPTFMKRFNRRMVFYKFISLVKPRLIPLASAPSPAIFRPLQTRSYFKQFARPPRLQIFLTQNAIRLQSVVRSSRVYYPRAVSRFIALPIAQSPVIIIRSPMRVYWKAYPRAITRAPVISGGVGSVITLPARSRVYRQYYPQRVNRFVPLPIASRYVPLPARLRIFTLSRNRPIPRFLPLSVAPGSFIPASPKTVRMGRQYYPMRLNRLVPLQTTPSVIVMPPRLRVFWQSRIRPITRLLPLATIVGASGNFLPGASKSLRVARQYYPRLVNRFVPLPVAQSTILVMPGKPRAYWQGRYRTQARVIAVAGPSMPIPGPRLTRTARTYFFRQMPRFIPLPTAYVPVPVPTKLRVFWQSRYRSLTRYVFSTSYLPITRPSRYTRLNYWQRRPVIFPLPVSAPVFMPIIRPARFIRGPVVAVRRQFSSNLLQSITLNQNVLVTNRIVVR